MSAAMTDGLTTPTVLVLTQRLDPTADYVINELNQRGAPVFRADAAEFPQTLTASARLTEDIWSGTFRIPGRQLRLEDVTGIYYRRPTPFGFPEGMSGPERQWANAEARLGFGGLLASLPGWLNHPSSIARAEYKPAQLVAARHAGLRVPATLLTNDPAEARQFADTVGPVIYKPFSPGGVSAAGKNRLIYASRVAPEELDDSSIRLTMHLFQEWVEHDYAVRLTVVQGRFFAASIRAHSAAAVADWRSDYGSLTYDAVETPRPVRLGVGRLMAGLDLRFGALDFLVTPEGNWVFLEINPNGQWAWIEEETGLPITAAIADALTGATT
jgi:ATP-grasp ribosomal peptide maturase